MDYNDLDTVLRVFYEAISGPAGGQDWELAASLYHPDARLVRTALDDNGNPVAFSFSVKEYRENTKQILDYIDFYEIQTARRVVRFGNVAQVFSTYEARDKPVGGALLKRGMNMIHMYNDGHRWWVMHVIWDDEREGVVVPSVIFNQWQDLL